MSKNIIFPVVESFVSINGEGQKAGQLALFIRFKGCNLNCSFCDTAWANDKAALCSYKSIEEICKAVVDSGVTNVTLTGGEPLMQPHIDLLIGSMLNTTNCNIEIETNGSKSIKSFRRHGDRLCFTLDYKLPGSGMEQYMYVGNYDYLQHIDTVKFVCGDNSDLLAAKRVVDKYNLSNKCSVYLSPVFDKINMADIVEFMKENKMNGVRMQLQMHKFIWNPNERGV